MNKLYPEDVDLADLAQSLQSELTGSAVAGYLEGRTALRDCVMDVLGSSELEAEEMIDTMVSRGFLRFSGDPSGSSPAGAWRVDLRGS
ncbi:MAG TPA: hypothetical protein VM686_11320 [Polyangiaceae bacterium]|nr:hypothetical protein [Polyangiaceae bacterium]